MPRVLIEAFVPLTKLNGMSIHYTQPGKSNQNACIERFNRVSREEVLDQHLLTCLDDVRGGVYGCVNKVRCLPMTHSAM